MSQPPAESIASRLRRAIHLYLFGDEDNITLIQSTPLLFMHVMALGVFFVPFSWAAVAACAATYAIRVFALTAGYHRYFSHNSFKTSRVFQFILAFLGGTAAQLGPLWWAAHHRYHHQHADTENDIHSPITKGVFRAHMGWIMCKKYAKTELDRIPDFAKYPELRFLDRFHSIPPMVLAGSLFAIGEWLAAARPAWGTTGWQFVFWGFFLSSVFVYHATFCINSLTHMVGKRRFNTSDHSRNSFILALITFGEGWHNNHHRYPVAARQGLYWWEIDITYYILKVLSWLGIVWDLRGHPAKLYEEAATVPVRPLADRAR
ncbi:MAG: acyl-CoA desaturase [Kiritimatiellae bacterium]|nr:acyl-CoA desaturase [Kiritimatiellia bacterium]MDW8457842.1 acyl-CoA desaturase [Verrucomicrobiota bacterium]